MTAAMETPRRAAIAAAAPWKTANPPASRAGAGEGWPQPRGDTGMRVLSLPGWQGSGSGHWQTRWEQLRGHRRVEQHDWLQPRRGDWMARLEEVLLDEETPALLVAHSLGCQLVAAWTAHSRHTDRVRGALLVAPPDTERMDTPPQLQGWRPIPRSRLPFSATLVASSDDAYCEPERAAEMARHWGAAFVLAGPRGHLNAESGLGDWPEGLALLDGLLRD